MPAPADRAHPMAVATTRTPSKALPDLSLPPSSESRKSKRKNAGREAGSVTERAAGRAAGQAVSNAATGQSAGKAAGKAAAPAGGSTNNPLHVASSAPNAPNALDAPWLWKSLTDSSANKLPPIFTKDGSYFFSAVGASIKIHSVATGEVVSTLEPPSGSSAEQTPHIDIVTCAVLNPHNPYQLITGSLDGRIRVWDFLDAVLLQTVNLTQPIYHITAHEKFRDTVVVAAKKARNNKVTPEESVSIFRVSLIPTAATAQAPIQVSSATSRIGKTRTTTGLAFSPSGAWLVATAGHKAYVCSTTNFKAGFTKFVSPQALTCLAFHPSEEYFATGDSTGCIRLWYCLSERAVVHVVGVEKTAQTTTLHWHAHAVYSLAFTDNGAYLLSGGEEAVLVIWQLHTGKKEFVPRVGAPILQVALSNPANGEEEYLLSLADASFVFISSGTLRISRSISRIKLDPAISYNHPSTSTAVPLAVHATTSTLMLPSSHPSTLQTFSPSSSKLLSELEVSPSNRVSRRDEKPLEPSRVERVVIDDGGEWMATVDSREGDEGFRGEVYLKLWWWDHKAEFWILNTRVDRPHGLKRVTSAAFNPGDQPKESLLLVTTGEDGNIKTWRIRSMKTKSGGSDTFWVTRSTFRFRLESPTHVCWSPDGSLFAVCVGPHVALYDPSTHTLHQVLTSAGSVPVLSTCFVGQSGRYLVVIGHRDVMVWDLVAQTMRWQYRSPGALDRIASHPKDEIFAIFERPPAADTDPPFTKVLVFRPASSTPSTTWTLPFHLLNTCHLSPHRSSSKPGVFTLVGITRAWAVVAFGDELALPEDRGAQAQRVGTDAAPRHRTLFETIFGENVFADAAPSVPFTSALSVPQRAQPWRGKEVTETFDAPAYMMPPLEMVFDTLLDGFLTARATSTVQEEQDVDEDEDADVGMDVDEVDAPPTPVLSSPRLHRFVDDAELGALADLFAQQLFKTRALSPPAPLPLPLQTPTARNGVRYLHSAQKLSHPTADVSAPHTPPGSKSPALNGRNSSKRKNISAVEVTVAAAADDSVAGEAPDATPSTPVAELSPLVKKGKKRKKSLG